MKPTLKEVKEHFKDAKVVKCLCDGKDYGIVSDIIRVYKKINVWCDSVNGGAGVEIYHPRKGYAEIIEYKTKPTQINIDIPQGYEIDKDNSTFECIKFKKIEKQLPNSWVDHVKSIGNTGIIKDLKDAPDRYKALRKLELLRDCYNDGWVADWEDDNWKPVIEFYNNNFYSKDSKQVSTFLNFKTAELRDKFLEKFKDIIEIAKPLL
jgi:hypothetical protein